jgi:helix-turn-helix protein
MSYQLTAWAVKQRTGSATRKAVLMALANAANHHTNACEPKIPQICEETELSDSSVRRALGDLETAGLIEREMKHNGKGHRSGYHYSFPHLAVAASGRPEEPTGHPDESLPVPVTGQELGQEVQGQDLEEPDGSSRLPAPRLTKIDGRDTAFDKLAEVCGVDPSGNRAREVAVALNGSARSGLPVGIRELAVREAFSQGAHDLRLSGPAFEGYLCGLIETRAQRYVATMNGAMLTPLALAKWWTDLATAARAPATKFGRRDVSAAEFGQLADRLEEESKRGALGS